MTSHGATLMEQRYDFKHCSVAKLKPAEELVWSEVFGFSCVETWKNDLGESGFKQKDNEIEETHETLILNLDLQC
jgi:hypothetical protein